MDNLPYLSTIEDRVILGLDYGKKVIGLARIHTGRDPFATSAGRVLVDSHFQALKDVHNIMQLEDASIIVCGHPTHKDGAPGNMAQPAIQFARELAALSKAQLYFQDEFLSSYAAKQRMLESALFNFTYDPKKVDEVAAVIILEDFLSRLQAQ